MDVTVYFTGEFAAEFPDIVQNIHDKGHRISRLSMSRRGKLTLLSYKEAVGFDKRIIHGCKKSHK